MAEVRRRWLDWKPRVSAPDPSARSATSARISEEKATAASSGTCGTFGTSLRDEKSTSPGWPDLFARFALSRCRFTNTCEVTALYRAFGDWCAKRGGEVCDLPAFAALLSEAGLPISRGRVVGLHIADPLPLLSQVS